MKSDSIPAQSSTASLISYLLLRAEAQETRQLGEFWGCRQGRGLCWCSVVLWASAVAVRNGEGIMNESPFQPFVGWLGVFFFFPNGLSCLEIALLRSPRSDVENWLCHEAELLLCFPRLCIKAGACGGKWPVCRNRHCWKRFSSPCRFI